MNIVSTIALTLLLLLPGALSVREKVGMLFHIRPEALVDSLSAEQVKHSELNPVLELTPAMIAAYSERPAGGFCLFAHNLVSPLQVKSLTAQLHSLPGKPLVSVDEEGGRVSRLANNPSFGLKNFGPAGDMAEDGHLSKVRRAGRYIGRYLRRLGFDIDFAPVADVNTNPENIIIGKRAFGSDPVQAGRMVAAFTRSLQRRGVAACLKHFPGHGDTKADTHFGTAVSLKSADSLRSCEFIPFRFGLDAGAGIVMVAHIAVPGVSSSRVPSSLCPEVIQGLLRSELGFDGVVVTDAMEMGAIVNEYGVGEAALKAIMAGADIVLMPYGYASAFDYVLEAVLDGRLPESRLDESVRRILALKSRIVNNCVENTIR